MSVVEFPRPERQIWACHCGCLTHYHYADGTVECSSCGEICTRGDWSIRPQELAPLPESLSIVRDGEPADIRWQRFLRDVKSCPDIIALILVREDGGVRTVAKCLMEGPDQEAWWRRRCDDILRHVKVGT